MIGDDVVRDLSGPEFEAAAARIRAAIDDDVACAVMGASQVRLERLDDDYFIEVRTRLVPAAPEKVRTAWRAAVDPTIRDHYADAPQPRQ